MENCLRDAHIREARMKKKKTSCTETDLAAVLMNTDLYFCFFRCYLPASEVVPHQVPFMTSAFVTNLLSPHIQTDRLRPQKFNKSQSSGHTSTAEIKLQ